MLTVSPSLSNATVARSRVPAVSLTFEEKNRGIPLLDFEPWYDGSETDYPHAACMTPAGTLIRVQNRAGTVYISRTANAASGSTYSSFSSMAGQAALSGGGIAIAAGHTSDRVIIAYVKSGGLRITVRRSSDDGATFTTGSDMIASNESSAVAYVAIGTEDNEQDDWMIWWNRGNTDLRYSLSANGGSSWTSASTVDLSAEISGFSGLAVAGDATYWHVAIAGFRVTTADRFLELRRMDSFGSWSTTDYPVVEADADSGVSYFRAPSLALFDGTAVVTFTEYETDLVSVSRSYMAIGTPGAAGAGWFSEPQPLAALTNNGAQLAVYEGVDTWIYTTCDGVWGATFESTALDLSAAVISIKATQAQDRATITAVVLADDAPDANWFVGGTLRLQAGYVGSAGAEYGTTWTFEVTSAMWHLKAGRLELTLAGVGIWERARWTLARQVVAAAGAAGSRAEYFRRALARAGGVTVSAASSPHAPGADWTTDHSPDLFAAPGDSWADVAARFLRVAPEGLVYEDLDVAVRSVATTDDTDADYSNNNAAKLSIFELQIGETAPKLNWIRVSSASRYYDAANEQSVTKHGPRMAQVYEADADSNTKAVEAADGALARARWQQRLGTLTAPWHPGLQLLDVVNIEDTRIGLTAADYRVLALALDYSRAAGKYNATIELGAL